MLLLLDTHVHIHSCFDLNNYFKFAFDNFSKNAKQIDKSHQWIGVLFLAEVEGVCFFSKLKEAINKTNSLFHSEKFQLKETLETNSIIISNEKNKKIIVLPGKQIIAKDNIEVLALCTDQEIEKNKNILTTVQNINSKNGIAVLPWGVGKWFGKRKIIVEDFLKKHSNEKFFLGDNSGRPFFWTKPNIFKIGNRTKHFVLPGSDALPIPSEENKTASFGFYLFKEIDETKPLESIRQIILSLSETPKMYGNLENLVPFFKNQIFMQLKKRKN